jgi:hypothetical protein
MMEIKFHPVSSVPFALDVKPVRASNIVPSWYREQDFGDEKHPTIKRCMPILDAMTAGYMYVMPADVHVDATNPDFLDFWLEDKSLWDYTPQILTDHHYHQYNNYPMDLSKYHKEVMRVNPLWAIETPEGYSTLFTNPIHQLPTPIHAMSGIIDTDSYASSGFLSFFVTKGFKGVIKQGTPMVQMIPFKRENWDSMWSSVVVDSQEKVIEQHNKIKHSSINHAYRELFRKLKRW